MPQPRAAQSAPAPSRPVDPEWDEELPQREPFQWNSVGKQLTGVVVAVEPSDRFPEGKRLRFLKEDGQTVMASCPTRLVQVIDDHQLIGTRCRITYVGDIQTERGQQVKDFSVQLPKNRAR